MKEELAKSIMNISSMEQFAEIWTKIRNHSVKRSDEDLENKCWFVGVCDNDDELEHEYNLYLLKRDKMKKHVFFPFEGNADLLKDIYTKRVEFDFDYRDQKDKEFKYIYFIRTCNIQD